MDWLALYFEFRGPAEDKWLQGVIQKVDLNMSSVRQMDGAAAVFQSRGHKWKSYSSVF
jgi:hypothetical protein